VLITIADFFFRMRTNIVPIDGTKLSVEFPVMVLEGGLGSVQMAPDPPGGSNPPNGSNPPGGTEPSGGSDPPGGSDP